MLTQYEPATDKYNKKSDALKRIHQGRCAERYRVKNKKRPDTRVSAIEHVGPFMAELACSFRMQDRAPPARIEEKHKRHKRPADFGQKKSGNKIGLVEYNFGENIGKAKKPCGNQHQKKCP